MLKTLVLIILARLLVPEDFGLVGIANIFVGFAQLVSTLGVGLVIIQKKNITEKHIRVGFTMSLITGILLFSILWESSPIISQFFFQPSIIPILRVSSLIFVIGGFGTIAQALMWRRLLVKQLILIEMISYGLGYATVGIFMAWRGYGAWSLVGASLGQSFIQSALSFYWSPHSLYLSLSKEELKELFYFGTGFTLDRVFNYFAGQGDYFIIGRFIGTQALGVYTRAFQIMVMPAQTIGSALDQVLFSSMSKTQDNEDRLRRAYLRGISVVSLATAPLGAFFFIMAPQIVEVLLGSNWMDAVAPLRALSLGVLFRTSYKISDAVTRATGAVYQRAAWQGVYAIAVTGGAYIGSSWGITGVAFCVSGAITLIYVLMAQLSLKIVNADWKNFIIEQKHGFSLAILVLLISLPIEISASSSDLPALIFLLISVFLVCLVLFSAALIFPPILGQHGRWAVAQTFQLYPKKNKLASQIITRMMQYQTQAISEG